jgi:hypothetical protein
MCPATMGALEPVALVWVAERPIRGLKRDRTARVIVAAHAFVQNLRRCFYDLGTDVRPPSV